MGNVKREDKTACSVLNCNNLTSSQYGLCWKHYRNAAKNKRSIKKQIIAAEEKLARLRLRENLPIEAFA